MYTDFKEINALYHHGIKGQKWGVIREKDDSQSKVDSEKNRLNYDAKIAKYEGELKAVKDNNAADLKIAKEKTRQTVADGRARVTEVLIKSKSEESTAKADIKAKKAAEFKKYATIGTIALFAALGVSKYISMKESVARNTNSTNLAIAKLTESQATKNATEAATAAATKAATEAAKKAAKTTITKSSKDVINKATAAATKAATKAAGNSMHTVPLMSQGNPLSSFLKRRK